MPDGGDGGAEVSAYDDAEASVESSAVTEYFQISINPPTGAVYRHTTASQDLTISGLTYTAIAAERGSIVVPGVSADAEFSFKLPVDHDFTRRFMLQGTPPTSSTIQWWRRNGGESRLQWTGEILSMRIEGSTAIFFAPYRAMETLKRSLPVLLAGRECGHQLYDANCGKDRNAFKVTAPVLTIAGRFITVDIATTANDGWALYGELIHVATGERRTIRDQVDQSPGVTSIVRLDLQVQIPELQVGNSVEIYAGCNHSIQQCVARFSNRQRYGGFNRMPTQNVFKFTNKGTRSTGEL